ncbi:Multi antimicrobial extrusion (MATE) [Asimina triloba]
MEAGFLPLSRPSLLRPSPVSKTLLAIPRKSFRPLQVSLFPSSISTLSIGSAAYLAFKAAHARPPKSHDAGEASVAEDDAGENEMLSALSGESTSIWGQMKEIVKFAGPATGLWICAPLMSLIDTAVIGQSSSLELAALGPGTVVCDSTSYVFMFLSVATSNMVATSLAKKKCAATFTGPKNSHIVPAANTYVQIRGLAWPATLVGLVAQSASLGMKDSWGPLKALLVASLVIAAFMMIKTLNKTGFSAFNVSVPSLDELLQIVGIAAPVFLTMTSKVAFYSLLTFFCTSMGTLTLAAHQVMIGVFCTCTVWGEPLSQTAQSFMPELIYGANRNLLKVAAAERLALLFIEAMVEEASLGTVMDVSGRE